MKRETVKDSLILFSSIECGQMGNISAEVIATLLREIEFDWSDKNSHLISRKTEHNAQN
jgi:hypothetical protein